MAKKNISTALETALVANEPFEYAHLVKFERPFAPLSGEYRTGTDRYVYITDAQRDITYDNNTYRAHGVLNVGSYSETTQARATNLSLTLSGEQLGTEITVTGTFATSGVFTATNTIVDGEVLDFVERGFREGDLVEIKRINNLNFSDGSTQKRLLIRAFTSNNQAIEFASTGSDDDDSDILTTELTTSALTFTIVNQEYKSALIEKGTTAQVATTVSNSSTVTLAASNSKIEIGQLVSGRGIEDETIVTSINGTTLKLNKAQGNVYSGVELSFTNPSFINREVFVYKAFINPETGAFFGDPVLTFKGVIASANVQENAQASRVQWSLTSHWGDFTAVTGRIGTDEIHRSLDANGISNPNLTIRPEYAGDLGFLHAETSLNTIANYQTTETRYRLKSKKRGGLAGLMGQRKYYQEEYQVQVDNEVDLSVYLQGRYIPLVYGVQRIEGVPVFADTNNNNSKEVYVAYSLAEGEIHGIYNMYIDGAPLICVDKNDSDVRSTSATNSDSQSMQCYGRMDKGGTLGGVNASAGKSDQYHACEELAAELAREDTREQTAAVVITNCFEQYSKVVNSSDISNLTVDENAEGLQHEESAKISHPYNMEFTFHSGRANQEANNLLSTVAKSSTFKRQNDYYTGNQPYWGPNHRLLDTAYAVMKFTIEADQTTIPEVEYVIKGKVLECFNYDGTFVADDEKNSGTSHTNFSEGDTVTVQVSSNGTSWGSDGNGNYRILDKYLFTTARNSSHYRFRLDKLPVLGDNTYVRLVKGSNYFYMLTHDHVVANDPSDTIQSQSIDVSSYSTTSGGLLRATLSSAGQTRITELYGSDATNSPGSSKVRLKFIGGTGEFAGLENKTLQATYLSGALTILGQKFTPNLLSNNSAFSSLEIIPDRFLKLSDDLGTFTAGEIVGNTFKNTVTGEEKEITAYNTTTKTITLESGFAKTPLTSHTYKITGRGKDLRASTNPAMQTLDLLLNERYGKGLDETNDIDLSTFKTAANICDTRSDVTIPLASSATCVEGDVYKLEDGSGNHVASGKVKASTSNLSNVTLTDVSGKFSRAYFNYITYQVGDIVSNIVNDDVNYYKVTDASSANGGTAPTHTSGTTNGFAYLSAGLTLTRVSGSGPTSLTMAIDGRRIKYSLYDSDFVKYWRYLGWEENRQWCVTRHQTNFIFATERSIFENINALLSHYNGILSYSNGKYVLDVETAETAPVSTNTFNSVTYDWNVNPEYIDNSDIIGGITINDNAQRNAKNTIKASISDPQNNFSSRSVSFFNSDFLKADRGIIKTGNYPVTGITSYYNARIGIEKELIQSRYSKEISFTVGQKGLLLKPGAVIAVTYDPFDFSSKLFRIENLTHNANCTTSIKAREYDDTIYAVSPQIPSKSTLPAATGDYGLALPGTPASLTTTNTKPGVITLNWSNASNYKEVIDSTEIWRANTQGSSGDITSHATLLTVVDNATTFSDAVGSAGTFYYWIRHRRISRRTSDNAAVRLVGDFSTAITAGVSGVAKVPSAQLDVDVSSAQIKFNASNALTPGDANQDVTLTATLRGITANNVTFTLVDADGSTTATDVTFTNNNASVVDTTAPYEATIDASSFSHNTENKFVKVTATDTASSEVFTELIPVTVVKDGSSGSVGIDAKAIKLTPSTHVVSYSATGGENTTVTFTTETQGTSGFSGTANYQFLVGGSLKETNTTGTFTLAEADEPESNEDVNVLVKLFDGTPSGSPEATDSVTIFGVKDGSDAISTFLTNAAHVVPTNNAGTVDASLIASGDITSAGGTFKVFIGATDRTTACTYAVQSESGVDATIESSTGIYTISSTGLSDLGTATFRVTIPTNVSPTGTEITIDRVYSIAKSKQGTTGAGGADSKTVQLTADDYSIVYDEDGSNPQVDSGNSNITLTANAKNFTSPRYQFVVDGTSGSFGTSTTGSFTIPSTIFNTPKTMQVNVREDGETVTEAFDSISIFAVKSGTNSYTVVLNNEAHAIPADENGANAVMTDSGCTIEAFKGSTPLNGQVSGTPTTGQFKVTVETDDDINITASTPTSTGNPVVFSDHSSLTAANAKIIYTINLEGKQTVLKQQTFTRVEKGDTGGTGNAGTNNAEVKIYQRSNNASSAPAVPDNNLTYKFSTGKFTVNDGNAAMDSWAISLDNAGTGQYLYTCTAKAVGTNGADETTVAPGDWSTPVRSVVEEPRTITDTIFNTSYNYGDPADLTTNQLNALKYDFSASNFATSTLPSGWSNTRPATTAVGYTFAVIKVVETAFEGDSETASNQTKSIIYIDTVSKWGRFDITDVNIGFQDEDNIRIRFGNNALGTTDYQTGSVASGLKNTSISINADGKITGANSAFSSVVLSNDKIVSSNVVGTGKLFATTLPEDGATLGATLGTNLKDSSNNSLDDADVRNDDLQIDYSGTTVRLKKGASTVINSQAAPDGLKNDQISLTASNGTVTLNNASTTNNTFNKASIALNNVTNDAQVKSDLTNLTVQTANLEVVSGELRPKSTLKNDQVVLSSAGVLSYAGGTNAALDLDDINDTGSTKTGAAKAQAGLDGSGNLTAGIKHGTTTFTAEEAINVRGGFDNLSTTPTLKIANANTGLRNTQVVLSSAGVLSYSGGTNATLDLDDINDTGSTKTFATYAGTGLDSNGRLKTSIISDGTAVTVADLKDTKLRTFAGFDGSGNVKRTVSRQFGGFGIDIGNLLGTGTGKLPRWTGSAWAADNDTDFKNDQIIDGSGNLKSTVDINLPNGGTFSIDALENVKATFTNIDDAANIKFDGTKIPIDGTTIDESGGNLILKDNAVGASKLASSIAYTGTITAGSGTNLAGLTGRNATDTGAGSDDDDVRIFAGSTFANRGGAKFRVTQGGEVRAEQVHISSTSGLAMSISEDTNRFQIRTPAANTVGTVLEVGGDSQSAYIPLKVSNDGTGVLRGFDIFTSGGTKLFDSSTGFTDAAFSEIAEATGSSVSSIAKTTSGNADSDSQKISLSTGQTITVKAQKSASFAAIGTDNNTANAAISEAYSRVPNSVTVKVLHNTSNSRSGATQVGGTLSFTEYSSGTQSATQYRFDQFVESEPGFHFAEVELNRASFSNSSMSQTFSSSGSVGAGTASFTSDGNFTLEFTHTISSGDHYYWIEIGGSGSYGNGTVNDVTDDSAERTLTLTAASGSTFNVSGGDGNEASDDVNNATITLAAGNGLTNGGDFTTNQGVAETITFNVVGGDGITANADEIEVAVDNTTIELSSTNGSGTVRAKTAAIANGGTALATADQIHTFVTSQGYVTSSGNTIIGTDTDLDTSGAEVVDQINVTDGVIQSMSKRTLTLANLGYTGATNATNYGNSNVDSHLNTSTASAGEVLSWTGSDYDWVAQSGGGGGSSTTINNNSNNRIITGSNTANTLEAESGLTYDGTNLDVTGTIRATADVIAYHSSDYRLKNNVSTIQNAVEKVSQIRGVEFDWNENQTTFEGHDIGVIAQEVEKVSPEIVVTRDDGYKAVNYQKLTALLIEAVKELKEEIKELKKDK